MPAGFAGPWTLIHKRCFKPLLLTRRLCMSSSDLKESSTHQYQFSNPVSLKDGAGQRHLFQRHLLILIANLILFSLDYPHNFHG